MRVKLANRRAVRFLTGREGGVNLPPPPPCLPRMFYGTSSFRPARRKAEGVERLRCVVRRSGEFTMITIVGFFLVCGAELGKARITHLVDDVGC